MNATASKQVALVQLHVKARNALVNESILGGRLKSQTMPPVLCVLALLSGLMAGRALASDLTNTFSTTGFGPVAYFSGQAQESVVTFTGSGSVALDLTPGVPLVAQSHGASFDVVGSNDGMCLGPTEAHRVRTTYTLSYQDGRKAVTEVFTQEQDATLFQICNNQFQFDVIVRHKYSP